MNQRTPRFLRRTELQRSVHGDQELRARAISVGPRNTSATNLIPVHTVKVSREDPISQFEADRIKAAMSNACTKARTCRACA